MQSDNVGTAHADTRYAGRRKAGSQLSPESYRQERGVPGVDGEFLTELLGLDPAQRESRLVDCAADFIKYLHTADHLTVVPWHIVVEASHTAEDAHH